MSRPRVVLAVGMPRSTAMLRPAMRRLVPQLHAHGIGYLDAQDLARLPHASGWVRDQWGVTTHRRTFRRQVRALLRDERARTRGGGTVVVVGDELLGRGELGLRDAQGLRPYAEQSLTELVAALDAQDVHIVLHVHRQDRLMELAQLQRINEGRVSPIDEHFPNRERPVLDYRDLVARLAAVPAVSAVTVRPVELGDCGVHPFVNHFLRTVDLEDSLDLDALGADLRPHPFVYSQQGAALACALAPMLDGDRERRVVRDFLVEHHAAGDLGTTDLFDRAERERIVAAHAEANRALFAEFMPDLPVDSYVDDSATFALGNVLHQPAAAPARTVPAVTTAGLALSAAATRALERSEQASRTLARRVRRRVVPGSG